MPSDSRFRTLVLILTLSPGLCGPLLSPVYAENPPVQFVLNSGNLLSCGSDNQGKSTALCYSADATLYRLTNEIDPHADYYAVLLTLRTENQTLHVYPTEVYLNISFPQDVGLGSIVDPIPEGCPAISGLSASPYFDVHYANTCVTLNILQGGSITTARWHECAKDGCPYSPIFDTYTQFAIGVSVPENQTVPFSFGTKVTIGEPSGCCFNDVLATSVLHWSTEGGAQSVSSQPPLPSWRVYLPYWLAGAIVIAVATATVLVRILGHMKPSRNTTGGPTGVNLPSIFFTVH